MVPFSEATGLNMIAANDAWPPCIIGCGGDDDVHYLQAAAPVAKTEIECGILPADFVCITL